MSDVDLAGQLFELDQSCCRALLATQQVGRLTGADSDSPVVVVNYFLHGDDVVVSIDMEALAVNIGDVVSFEVDTLDDRTRCGKLSCAASLASSQRPTSPIGRYPTPRPADPRAS